MRAEVFLQGDIDLIEMKILVIVRSEQSENLCRRKGKGSLTMTISQGLVSPNSNHKLTLRKGKKVNIPLLLKYVRQRKSCF